MALSSRHGMGDCLYAHACVHERAGRANSTSAGPASQEKTVSEGAGGYSGLVFSFESFSLMKARMSSAMASSRCHCSL